jgi:hypothetical protein
MESCEGCFGDFGTRARQIIHALLETEFCSQASEGMWGMPGHTEAMKAVVSCDKLGGAAHTH